jgi:hypothetical protein
MAKEVVSVRWLTTPQVETSGKIEPRRKEKKFSSRKEPAIYVIESDEIREIDRHTALMAVAGAIFDFAHIKLIYERAKSEAEGGTRTPKA